MSLAQLRKLPCAAWRSAKAMSADAHEAYGDREGHNYADHLSDLVNNEYGRQMGEKIAAANPGASESQLRDAITREAKNYMTSGNYARPSDFE
ncbi:hypothetical protein [Streptomyces virginiae]|uniref:hypothetical protein n=1 Tax=Streptomyces virginiae TaxID=1961 RepID=UPI00386E7881|nr:hypothetical protein OG253_00165 [Streptomyces virginiae]WTB27267.1 hypothetical protein OG253_40670 [Streptomyces virginiae]